MTFKDVVEAGRKAYRRLGHTTLCYEPRPGVHVLPDLAGQHEPCIPFVWVGHLPGGDLQHDVESQSSE
jgi:hypothetical protein